MRTKPSQSAVLLLLVAFLYQLHACRCGTQSHNGWCQVASATISAEHTHGEEGHSTPKNRGDDNFYDGTIATPVLTAQPFTVQNPNAVSSYACHNLAIAFASNGQLSLTRLEEMSRSQNCDALSVRAILQVFLI